MTIRVIIPTHNEAATIGRLIDDLRRYDPDHVVDIVVVDAHSPDGTADVARRQGATVLTTDVRSRAVQLNWGARHATADVLYFVHADVRIHPDYVADIRASLRSGYDAGCYRFRFDAAHPLLRFNSYGTRFEGLMSRGGDQTLFIRRELFERIGGFDEHYVIMEDFEIISRIRRAGRFRIVPKDVVVSARKYETNSWLRVQIANLTAFLLFYLNVAPSRIARTYRAMLNNR